MQTRRKNFPYNPELKILAKDLRRNMTLSEVLLWNELKKKQMLGFDFDRQRPIGKFIVDFYCKELQLAIEIDGDTHIYKYDYDEERQWSLEMLGIHFLRFEDIEVKKNMNNVLRVIENWIEKNKPTPGPSREGNPYANDLTSDIRPTPKPRFKGDNHHRQGLRAKNKPTPSPSGGGEPI
jgi:very-short-patch-repair endonuclease